MPDLIQEIRRQYESLSDEELETQTANMASIGLLDRMSNAAALPTVYPVPASPRLAGSLDDELRDAAMTAGIQKWPRVPTGFGRTISAPITKRPA